MRCLYCGKELALLKRWRGGGEFCSDAHKQSYQEEYDRIALGRLLQAQKKAPNAPAAPVQPTSAPMPVSVEEPAAMQPQQPEMPEPQPEIEQPTEPQLEASPETAHFVVEKPGAVESSEEEPYVESWVAAASQAPAIPQWAFERESSTLSAAELVPLKPPSFSSNAELAVPTAAVVTKGLPPGDKPPSMPPGRTVTIPPSNSLPLGRPRPVEVSPRAVQVSSGTVQAVEFRIAVEFGESDLCRLRSTSIEFPAEDSDAVLDAPGNAEAAMGASPAQASWEPPVPVATLERVEEPAHAGSVNGSAANGERAGEVRATTPHATLEALSRLHQVMHLDPAVPARFNKPEIAVGIAIAETAVPAKFKKPEVPAGISEMDEPADIGEPELPANMGEPAVPASISEPAAVATVHASPAEEPAAPEEPSPRGALELLDIPVKIFTPAKRGARPVNALSPSVPALVPRLKALPLRPKVAPAPFNAAPQANPAPAATPAAPTKPPAQVGSETKAKPAPKPEQTASKPKIEAVAPAAPVSKTALVSPAALASKATPVSQAAPVSKAAPISKATPASVAKGAPLSKPAASKATPPAKPNDQTQPAKAAEAVATKSPTAAPVATPAEPAKNSAATKTGQREKPVAADAGAKPLPAPSAKKPDPARPTTSDDGLPSFGSIGRPATVWGSLRVKLGIAILLVAGGCTAYFGWGGKPHKAPVPGTAAPADGAGPSIIIGEGGWVVGWGGETSTAHTGREITIYRPSLKLSDYRIEFQGDIDTNSMGWVFRASDPDNYYAMKLTQVSTGVSPKVALFKYIVAKGRQIQVGRVPIDTEVRNDTVFKVRVDVRGPKFATYVQGQPVDVWTDDQLKSGGVGFLNERGERGRIKSVSIRYLTGDEK